LDNKLQEKLGRMHSCFQHVFADPVSIETLLFLMNTTFTKFE